MKRFGWTHFGVMIPSLPAPHRYLGMMTMAGETGQQAFDVLGEENHADPLDPVTVAVSTGAEGAYERRVLSARSDCTFTDNKVRLGPLAEIRGVFPHYEVSMSAGDLSVQLTMDCRPEATWFIKSPLYDHLGFMAHYRGVISLRDQLPIVIEGIGNLEYARCASPAALLRRSFAHALPIDGFSYHVVELPGQRQILFAELQGAGETIDGMLILRDMAAPNDDVSTLGATYKVVGFAPEPASDGGRTHYLPRSFVFASERLGVSVSGTYDCPQRFGVGVGYISGYRATVHIGSETIDTRGYAEYVRATDT
ncbi:DUF6670 family protein [Tsukamurella columbiensis]|uniref:Uncharacterized protein n=1 Tax=Tsukamurella columbiensis TaxID=128509 RepID=A0ABX1LLG0_9ACTN|nr:DUF6670 family protein [Tsukamurella columbiensis]NMD56991.1 hypothetical protein [Tsukamurella columbiensis]